MGCAEELPHFEARRSGFVCMSQMVFSDLGSCQVAPRHKSWEMMVSSVPSSLQPTCPCELRYHAPCLTHWIFSLGHNEVP